MPPHYGPADASLAPRYTGVRTFARCPHVTDPAGVDVAAIGIPFDTATSNRPGARFGPEAIRSASIALRPYNPALRVDVFAALSIVDGGDLSITPGNAERTAAQIAEGLAWATDAGVTPLVLGGDHSIVLGELRAHAAVHGPLALVLLDAHADTWEHYYGERYFHGTPFRRALEEGLIDPTRSVLAGMRGGLYSARDLDEPRAMGFDILTGDELRATPPAQYAQRVRERVGDAPAFLSFDIDVMDPAFAPGTGTPEIAGLLPHEALAFLRSLAGMAFVGFDLVEVSPIYDGPGQVTAVLAANIAFELLSLRALANPTPFLMTTITINNWQDPEHTAWAYRHIRELIPTARIARGATLAPLEPAAPAPAAGALPAERLLTEVPHTDGVLVLHRGALVLERYQRGQRADDVHLMQSVSKSITGTLAGVLVHAGALAPEDAVTRHVPELEGSSFDGATVRDLLDMRAATRFDETYDDPQSDIRASEAQFRWAPGTPPAADAIAYLRTLANHDGREHGGRFEYRSILTDLLGLVLERAAGRPFAEALGEHLWAPMGAGTDAQVTVDGAGFAVADGGVCVTLPDLARFGRLVAQGGRAHDGTQVVPEAWLADTRAGAGDSAAAFAADEHADAFPGGHYRNQWWVPAGGERLVALGIHGQFLLIDHPTQTVMAVQSTWPVSLDADRRARVFAAFDDTVAQLA